jgi:hypothetical protein
MTRILLTLLVVLALPGALLAAFQPARTYSTNAASTQYSHKSILLVPSSCNRISTKRIRCYTSSPLSMNGDNDSDESVSIIGVAGLVAQPFVWVSLYFVATTGAGLPAGPFGLLGGLEGLAYLAVVGLVAASIGRSITGGSSSTGKNPLLLGMSERISWFTLVAALLTLLSLVVDQGCVPNAKPILDYSAYLPICNPEESPGFFGS